MSYKILKIDPYLAPFASDIELRMDNYKNTRASLLGERGICEFAQGHKYFGIHKTADGRWVYREWAPAADEMYLTGDFSEWDLYKYKMDKR